MRATTARRWTRPEDERWADRVALRMVVHHHAPAPAVEEVLAEAHQACTESERSAADLFGPPDPYAAEAAGDRVPQQRAAGDPGSGADVGAPAPAWPVLLLGAGTAGVAASTVLGLSTGWMLPVTAAGLGVGAACAGAAAGGVAGARAAHAGHPTRARGWWGLAAVVVLAGAGVAVGVPSADSRLGQVPVVALAAISAVLLAVGWLLPTQPGGERGASLDPDRWFGRLDGLLRGRWSLPRAQARRLTDDARTYWVLSGAAHPREEFGTPQAHALALAGRSPASVSGRALVRARVSGAVAAAFAVAGAGQLSAGSWGLTALAAVLALACGYRATQEWHASRLLRPQA